MPIYRWVELRQQGRPSRGLRFATLRDISSDVAEEAERAAVVAAAGRADAARAAFLSTVNHELRTPLNAIVGFSEFLANPSTTPSEPARVQEYAAIIHEAGHDLLGKVAAMIDITRMQSGAYDFAAEPLDVAAFVRSCVEGFRADRGLAPDALPVAAPRTPVTAQIDPRAFRSALLELLANAFKHGLGSGVRVVVTESAGSVAVAVQDSGPGAAADRLAQLNRDLSPGDETLSRAKGGLGLGLTLARGVMALHGGEAAFENRKGGGAAATLRLPASGAGRGEIVDLSACARRRPPPSRLQGRRNVPELTADRIDKLARVAAPPGSSSAARRR